MVTRSLKMAYKNVIGAFDADIKSTELQLTKSAPTEASSSDLNSIVGKVLPKTDEELIVSLAMLKPIDYDRARLEQAKCLGIRPATLDNIVKAERERNNNDDSPFTDIEPWHETVNPAQLLDEITSTIQRFIVLDKHQAQAAALWVGACWFVEVIPFAPFALINAPERACGKTQLLTVMGKLTPRTLQASGISPAAFYRTIEKYHPTIFIDEIETVLKDNEPLRGIFNAGYSRDSSIIIRCVGDDLEPRHFNIWGMKAIAGINAIKLADTVTSRSIIFELRRKTADEKVERLRMAEPNLFADLTAKLARFSADYIQQVKNSKPILPNALGDRDQDNWEPLLQVANVAGGHWIDTALKTALRLSCSAQTPMSSANELLADIQEIFDIKSVIKITTAELIQALCDDPEKSWATYNRGKPLSPKQLSSKLKPYGISSKTIRTNNYETAKGFECDQFKDVFTRYLADPLNLPSQSNNSLEANNHMVDSVTDDVTCYGLKGNNCDGVTDVYAMSNAKETTQSRPILGCDGVTDKTPISRSGTATRNDSKTMRF